MTDDERKAQARARAKAWRAAMGTAEYKIRRKTYVESPEAKAKRKERSRAYSRQWRLDNPDKVKAQHYAYRKSTKAFRDANRDRLRAGWRAAHKANRARRIAQAKAWRLANPRNEEQRQLVVDKVRRWAEANPEKAKAHSRKNTATRRARKNAAFVEVVDPQVVFAKAKGVCGWCHKKITKGQKWHADHIVPLAKQGVHAYVNHQPCHDVCNLAKGAKMPTGQLGLFQRKAV